VEKRNYLSGWFGLGFWKGPWYMKRINSVKMILDTIMIVVFAFLYNKTVIYGLILQDWPLMLVSRKWNPESHYQKIPGKMFKL
jgi:hypothetical protein